MKKVFIIAFLTILGATQAQVTFKPGLRGGLNFAHFTKGDFYNNNSIYSNPYNSYNNVDYTSKTDFYIGFFGALKLTKHYTLQPEIDYSRQGSNYKGTNQYFNGTNYVTQNFDQKLDLTYLSIAVINKFAFNGKFNVHLGPTIDFIIEKKYINPESDVDLAFVLGAEYNITKNFGIEARVKKGIIPVIDFNDNHTNVVFSVGASYTFDVK